MTATLAVSLSATLLALPHSTAASVPTPTARFGAASHVAVADRSAASGLDHKATVLENWPCAGCVVVLPNNYRPGQPTPILVALHGDEGVSSLIADAWAPVTTKKNVILFAPQCPTDEGCRLQNGSAGFTNSWWGWFQYSRGYDDNLIAREVDRIAARYALDPAREYLVGWSGGADYLGWYAPRHAARFAAVAYVAGGTPYDAACPTHKLAAYFLMGSADFRYLSGQPAQVRELLARCGDPTKWVVLAGADHQGTITSLSYGQRASSVLAWLLHHRLR